MPLEGLKSTLGNVGDVQNYINPQIGVRIVIWILAIGILGVAIWIVFNWARTHCKAWIYDERTDEFRQHVIRRHINKKTGDTRFVVSVTKESVPEDVANNRKKLRKFYVCLLTRGLDGHLRSTNFVSDYIDEKGKLTPYYHPINNNIRDHIWHEMKLDTFKYKLTSTLEKLAPYATFAIVAIMSMMMWYVTNGR